MTNKQIELDVLVNGKPVREYAHEGKSFIESREGTEYALRVKNQTSGRVLAVLSVDGINIISGKPVTDAASETGYVLGPWEEQTLRGYRVDEKTVATFKFVKRGESYATEKGEGQGNGVIAVRVFGERETNEQRIIKLMEQLREQANKQKEKEYVYIDRPYPVYPWHPYRRPYSPYYGDAPFFCGSIGGSGQSFGHNTASMTAQNACDNTGGLLRGASAMQCSVASEPVKCSVEPQSFDMGSGWGKAQSEVIREVAFEAGKLLVELVMYYASLEGLKTMGVELGREKSVSFPEPFKRGFAEPPKGWKKT